MEPETPAHPWHPLSSSCFLFIAPWAGDELRATRAAERAGSSRLDLTDCLGRIRSSRESFAISFPLENVINSLTNC